VIKKETPWILWVSNLWNIQNSYLIEIRIDLDDQRYLPIFSGSYAARLKLEAILV
jgi:hypothetical protein